MPSDDQLVVRRVVRVGDREYVTVEPRFLPGLVADLFDWLISDYGLVLEEADSGKGGAYVDRMYAARKTVVRVSVSLGHGCGSSVSLAPPGYPITAFDQLAERLAIHGLPAPPDVRDFRRRVQVRSECMSGERFRAIVAGALVPVADALRLLGPHELSGDWGV